MLYIIRKAIESIIQEKVIDRGTKKRKKLTLQEFNGKLYKNFKGDKRRC